MISVVKADVPDYLRRGEFYRNLSAEDDEVFEIPANTFKADSLWEGPSDLAHLLSSFRYWMIDMPLPLIC